MFPLKRAESSVSKPKTSSVEVFFKTIYFNMTDHLPQQQLYSNIV